MIRTGRVFAVWFATLVLLISPLSLSARAATIRVPGDQPTIQAGIDAASNGDVVLVAVGTYTGDGNKYLDFNGKPIIVRSEAGALATIIDCQGVGHGFWFHSGESPSSVVEGFTIRNGRAPEGGGMSCVLSSSPTIRSCIFERNQVSHFGGAVFIDVASPSLLGCTLSDNVATYGGAVFAQDSWGIDMADCRFLRNSARWGGGIYIDDTFAWIDNCWLAENTAVLQGGGIYCGNSAPEITHGTFVANTAIRGGGMTCDGVAARPSVYSCTFYGNTANEGSGVHMRSFTAVAMERTIIAFAPRGMAVFCDPGAAPVLGCCDVFGNLDGDWVGCIADQVKVNGNFSEDPLFCSRQNQEFTLRQDSPCAPPHSPAGCDLIGAWPVDCRVTAIEPATWGVIKYHFR